MNTNDIFTFGWIIFAVMVGIFLIAAFYKKIPIGIALVLGAVCGALVNGDGIPVRHLVEGLFTYYDPILIIFTALVFMKVIEANGALSTLAREIIGRFGNKPIILLVIMTLFIMFPAMLTGITTTSMLTTGALMAPPLMALGLTPVNAAAMIALVSMMGMLAPPINLLVMLIGQGVDMPYIGFEGPLAILAFPLALFVSFSIAYKYVKSSDKDRALEKLPYEEGIKSGFYLYLPLIVVFGLMIAVRVFSKHLPDIGAPLIFVLGSVVALFTGKPVKVHKVVYKALIGGLPVLGLLAGIGLFLQIMTLTGVRGLLVVTVLSLPMALAYLGLLISLPLFGGVSAFASAMVFGIPFLLSLLGRNEIVVAAGIALLAGLGDVIPPSAIEARFASQIVGIDNFMKVVKRCIPFIIISAIAALGLIHWANEFSFLTP